MTYGENGDAHESCRERIGELESEVNRLYIIAGNERDHADDAVVAWRKERRELRAEIKRLRKAHAGLRSVCAAVRDESTVVESDPPQVLISYRAWKVAAEAAKEENP